MDDEIVRRLELLLTNAACLEVEIANGWLNLSFGNQRLVIQSAWRLVQAGEIQFASDDDTQAAASFEMVSSLLRGGTVSTVAVVSPFHDLTIRFESEVVVQTFSDSSKYENWNFFNTQNGHNEMIIAGPNTLYSWFPPMEDK